MKRVLFLCTGNSVRSQMAEGLMKSLGSGQWKVESAGLLPSYVHPLSIQAMKEIGIDISHQTSKSTDHFLNQDFDYIITLCDYAAMSCPTFPGPAKRIHWPLEDPISSVGTTEQRMVAFRRIRDQIKAKIEAFLKSEQP